MENLELNFIKNKELLSPLIAEPHAIATYRIKEEKYGVGLTEEIALGQSLGAWDEKFVRKEDLRKKVAKVLSVKREGEYLFAEVAFPWNVWMGNLGYLTTLLFGKMSFYDQVTLYRIKFTDDAFGPGKLQGPKNSISDLRILCGAQKNLPLLMGILKPNVAMTSQKIAELFLECAQSGLHILKDDEIRHDASLDETLERVELVEAMRQKNNIKSLYAVHLHGNPSELAHNAKKLEENGASALLINSWIVGLAAVQEIRQSTKLPLLSHPALVGAFGFKEETATIHPQVTLGTLIRVAGCELSLFPSPYGKLGLPLDITQKIKVSLTAPLPIHASLPVPSAGIKPEHAPQALSDFGNDFVLNAGTGIFAGTESVRDNVNAFKQKLYGAK